MKSPIGGYQGGKSRLAKKIIEQLPEHTCYCEPFCGAAWVLFRKEPSKVEVINDMNRDLVTLFRVLQNHPEEFARHFKFVFLSRDEYQRLLRVSEDTLTDVQRAVRFFYLQKLGFGGKVQGRTFGTSATSPPRLNPLRIEEDVVAAHRRLAGVVIEHLSYMDVIRRYDRAETLFYLDPPYWGCEQDYGPGVFDKSDFTELAYLLAELKGRFLLSLNDVPQVREIFAPFKITPVTTTYSVGLSNNKAQEVFISNY